MERERHLPFICSVVIFLIGMQCFDSPTQLNGQHALDCSKATLPPAGSSDTVGVTSFVEIYDFQQRLVAYSPMTSGLTTTPKMSYSWDGTDMNGNPVGPGKYVSKISIIDHVSHKNQCVCTDVYVAP